MIKYIFLKFLIFINYILMNGKIIVDPLTQKQYPIYSKKGRECYNNISNSIII